MKPHVVTFGNPALRPSDQHVDRRRKGAAVINFDEARTAMAVRRLGSGNQRLLSAVLARVAEVDDNQGEAAACELIDRLIDVIRRP